MHRERLDWNQDLQHLPDRLFLHNLTLEKTSRFFFSPENLVTFPISPQLKSLRGCEKTFKERERKERQRERGGE